MAGEERQPVATEVIRRELEKGVYDTGIVIAPYLAAARRIERALRDSGHLRTLEEFWDHYDSVTNESHDPPGSA